MAPKKKNAGQKRRGLKTISESSEPLPTENSSSSTSSPRPRTTASSASTSSSHSSSQPSSSSPSQPPSSSSSNPHPGAQIHSHPGSQAHPRPSPQAHSHPTSSARHSASCCTAACRTGAKSSSSSARPSPSTRSRGTRSVSPNPLLPSIPPPTRRPRTMTKNKSKPSSSSGPKGKIASESKTKSGDRDMHNRLPIRSMKLHPEDWLAQAFPAGIHPLLEGGAPEVVRFVYKEIDQLFLMMDKLIKGVKDGVSPLHMVILKPLPLDVIQNDMIWGYSVAPHCRFTYLEVQQTLILHIATESRLIEVLPKSDLNFDDTDMGVQGHALGRFKYGLKKQLSAMGIIENRWEFACCKSRQSTGIITDTNDPAATKAIHCVDRMFVPGIIRHPKYDAKNQPWPTMVIECATDYANLAARCYLQYCVDWWFTQSEGFTKYVLLMYFDYNHFETIVEKWIRAPETPHAKKLAQTIKINLQPDDKGRAAVVVHGEDLVLDFESLMARPKCEGESDIIFDKGLMNGFGNGYLVPWPNLGNERRENLKRSGINVSTARKLLNYPLSTLKEQLGPALAETLKTAEKASKAVGADADVSKSRMRLTLTRNKVGKEEEKKKGELSFAEARIPVDLSIGEALAIMAEKEEVEEK